MARSLLEETANIESAPPLALYDYAMVLEEEQEYRESIKYLEKAFEKSDDHHIVHSLGRLYQKVKNYRTAIKFYELAMNGVSNPLPIMHNIADCYHFLNEYNECVRVTCATVHINPKDKISWENFRYSLVKLGKRDASNKFIGFLRKLESNSAISEKDIESITTIMNDVVINEFGNEFLDTIKTLQDHVNSIVSED